MQPHSTQPSCPSRVRTGTGRPGHRRAFSLIELMVVIVIIGILAAFLLPAVMNARRVAQEAGVLVEFKNLEKGIADFHLKYGEEPASGITLYETPAGWAGVLPATRRSRAFIRQIWPQFDFTISRDINGDDDELDTIEMNGAECLVFFLGGVNATQIVDRNDLTIGTTGAQIMEWSPQGFSASPTNPFQRGGTRVGPWYEFSINRLMNSAGTHFASGMPEYRDGLPGQLRPILYGSSYGGKGYRDADFLLTTSAPHIYDRYVTQPSPSQFTWHYRRYSSRTNPISNAYPVTVTEFNSAEAFNPRSYQLISPGIDGEYGLGGVLHADMRIEEQLLSPPYNNADRAFERDNITNFKGGRIE